MIEDLFKELKFLVTGSLCGCDHYPPGTCCCESSCEGLSPDEAEKCYAARAKREAAAAAAAAAAAKAAADAKAEASANLGTLKYDATDGYKIEGSGNSLTISLGEAEGERTISLGHGTIFCHGGGGDCRLSAKGRGSYHVNFRIVARAPIYNSSGAVIPYADGKRYPDDVYAEVYEHTKAGVKVEGAKLAYELVDESLSGSIKIDPSKMTLDPYNTGDEKGKTLLFIVGPKLDSSNSFAAPDNPSSTLSIKIPKKS